MYKKSIQQITRSLTFALFTFVFLSAPQLCRAQNSLISLDLKDAPLKQGMEEIEKQTKYLFVYDKDCDLTTKISVKVVKQPLGKTLDEMFKGTKVVYRIDGGNIVLMPKTPGTASKPSKSEGQKSGQRVLKGKVVDGSGQPVIGATVVIKGTTVGASTGVDGSYALSVPQSVDNPVLSVSFIGYESMEQPIGNRTEVDVTLHDSAVGMEEVVVIGYGTMKKKDLTGAVSSIKMTDEPVNTVSSISHALAGKAAGLQVNLTSARPGAATTMRIRGAASVSASNDPLIIIDGFPVNPQNDYESESMNEGQISDNILGTLNPNDIESIDVLKDASSTAIYGSRAANGVILITTKRGATGAPKVSYSGSASVQFYAKKYEMLSASDFMRQTNRYYYEKYLMDNGIGVYGGKELSDVTVKYTPRYTDAAILFPYCDTDWFDAISRTGFQTQHNISMTGGTDWTKYFVSFNYFRQNGLVRNNDISRYTGRVNLEQKIAKWAKVGVNLTLSRNVSHGDDASLESAASFNPLIPVKEANGEWGINPSASYEHNPVALLDIIKDQTKDRLLTTAFLEINPIADLTLKAQVGIDRKNQESGRYVPASLGPSSPGEASLAKIDESDYLLDLTANYVKTWNSRHTLNAMIGYSFQQFNHERLNGMNSDFMTDIFGYDNLDLGAAVRPAVHSYRRKSEMASFFGRLNYNYDDRYLLTATLRVDGSSAFAANHRWGYFPSAAAAWRFSEEKFMEGAKGVLSNGKLRIGYGQTGNSSTMDGAVTYYRSGSGVVIGNKRHPAVTLYQIGNPNLKWETTAEWNFGLDLGFFNNRLNITAEYFRRVISDLLNTRSLQVYNEIKTIADNIGKTKSQGVELTVNATVIEHKNFTWKSDLTFSFYRDRWLERADNWQPNIYEEYYAPVRPIYTYLSNGLIQPGDDISHMPGAIPGEVKLIDRDSYLYDSTGAILVDEHGRPRHSGKPDGKIDDADGVLLGSADPDYLMGFNNTFRWKNLDLNIYFYGQFGLWHSGSYKWTWNTSGGLSTGHNKPVTLKDTWSHDNLDAKYPTMMMSSASFGSLGSDYFYRKIWFIRCRNITLGYTFPKSWTRGWTSNIRLYAEIQNPFVLTPYDGLDPETDNTRYAYPNIRSVNFGLDITF